MDFCSKNNVSFVPPKADEFELAIFGPGVGECILMHVGDGNWFVIDSCRFPGSKTPAAIAYLETLKINPSSAIQSILATHWHDDHVKGLADIVRRCPQAAFAMSAALEQEQFFQLVYEANESNKFVEASSTASEFADILDHFVETGKKIVSPDIFASEGSILYLGGVDESVRVQALSPSSAAITSCKTDVVAKLMTNSTTRCFRQFDPNDLSVAVQVSTPVLDLLLKADLENSDSAQLGWQAVLSSKVRTKRTSQLVKVGHHGSVNAHNDDVWSSMVDPNPLAVVTPYSRLADPLPREHDIKRIKSLTNRLYSTTWPPSSRPPRRRGVDSDIRSATKVRRARNRAPGFVRVRFSISQTPVTPTIELYGSAKQI